MASVQQPEEIFSTSPEKTPPVTPDADRSLADRKMGLLQRAGLFGEDTRGATIERAYTLEDLRKAYRLVHNVYLGTGYLSPEPAGLRLRIYETTSETATFVAKKDGEVVGVLSVVGDSKDLGLPSDGAFKTELDEVRASGARLCELTNQAVAEGYRKSAVPTELMRCAIAHGIKAGYHYSVATVSPSHNGFYELMGFQRLGSQRSYSHKVYDPVVALTLDLDRYRQPAQGLNATEQFIYNFVAEGNRFLTCVSDWAKQAVRHFLNPELLEQLFVSERNFLAECSPAELMILQRRWGQELFSAVTGVSYPPFEVAGAQTPASVPPPPPPRAEASSSNFQRDQQVPEEVASGHTRTFRRLRGPSTEVASRNVRSRRKSVLDL